MLGLSSDKINSFSGPLGTPSPSLPPQRFAYSGKVQARGATWHFCIEHRLLRKSFCTKITKPKVSQQQRMWHICHSALLMINSLCHLISRTLSRADFQPYHTAWAEASTCSPSLAKETSPAKINCQFRAPSCSLLQGHSLHSVPPFHPPTTGTTSLHPLTIPAIALVQPQPHHWTTGGFFTSRFQ